MELLIYIILLVLLLVVLLNQILIRELYSKIQKIILIIVGILSISSIILLWKFEWLRVVVLLFALLISAVFMVPRSRKQDNLMVVISATNHYNERSKYIVNENKEKYNVIYVTSDFAHIPKTYFKCEVENAIQLHVIPYYKNLSVSRILSHCLFSYKVFWLLVKLKPQKVYSEIPNNTLAVTTSIYKRISHCELILDVFDMWPEALPVKSKNSLFVVACNVWRWFRNKFLRYADKVYAECDYFREIMIKEGVCLPVETKYLMKPTNNFSHELKWESEILNICYVGSINNIIDIPLMIKFITELSKEKRVRFHIVGTGEGKDKLCQQLKNNENLFLKEYGVVFDPEKLQEIFNQCSFGINFLLPNLAIGLTMKSVTYLQGSLPLLNTVDGDTRHLVEYKKIGININRDDIESSIHQILSLSESDVIEMRNNANKLFMDYFAE